MTVCAMPRVAAQMPMSRRRSLGMGLVRFRSRLQGPVSKVSARSAADGVNDLGSPLAVFGGDEGAGLVPSLVGRKLRGKMFLDELEESGQGARLEEERPGCEEAGACAGRGFCDGGDGAACVRNAGHERRAQHARAQARRTQLREGANTQVGAWSARLE